MANLMKSLSFTTVKIQKYEVSIEVVGDCWDCCGYKLHLTDVNSSSSCTVEMIHESVPHLIRYSSKEALKKYGEVVADMQSDSYLAIEPLNNNTAKLFFGRYRNGEMKDCVAARLNTEQLSEFRKALFDVYSTKEEEYMELIRESLVGCI